MKIELCPSEIIASHCSESDHSTIYKIRSASWLGLEALDCSETLCGQAGIRTVLLPEGKWKH